MIKVKQEVTIYEEDGKDVPMTTRKSLGVESHWNWNERVILVLGEKRITVIGRDLTTAITNAMNINSS